MSDTALLEAERQTVTADELRAAFKASRLRFKCGYGLQTAMRIPSVRRSLELHAIAARRRKNEALQELNNNREQT